MMLSIGTAFATGGTGTDRATSKQYVINQLNTRQDNLGPETGTKAVTFGDEAGEVSSVEVKTSLGTSTSDASLPTVGSVNTGLSDKQNTIPAKDSNTVLTYTGVAGSVGEKGIYQDSGTYSTQMDKLIDAATFNEALRAGIESEFICAGYAPTGECWLWTIHNEGDMNGLPAGYTQLEYIDTDGNSWIDTGITPTATTLQFDYKMQILQQGYVSLFGAVASTTPRYGFRVYYQPSGGETNILNWQSGSFVGQQVVTWNDVLQGTVIATQGVSVVSTINGTTQTYDSSAIDLTQSDTIFLGTSHLRNTSGRGPTRTWSFKITKDGTVVRDFVPAKNASNVIGMYDFVSGQFFTNAGEGDFIAGPVVNSAYTTLVPAGYTPLEYIQSDGNQYINTGISGLNTGDWEIYVKWMITGQAPSTYAYVCGVYQSEETNSYRIILKLRETDAYYVSGNSKAGGGGSVLVSNVPANEIHDGIIRNGSVSIDGVEYLTTIQGETIPNNNPIVLFGLSRSYKIVGRIYAAYAKKDGVLQYEYIPARRNSDNALGMYDRVSGTFKTNTGTGTFTAGNPINNNVYIPQV